MNDLFDDDFSRKLKALAETSASEYQSNKPFPFMYFDNFLPSNILESALQDYPSPRRLTWNEFDNPLEQKLAFDIVEKLPASNREILYFLNSRPMLKFLEILTGIEGLIPDPYFEGGGLHQILPGGKLAVHADFNRHKKLLLDRRINVLIYLNKEWKEDYGGHFELWDRDMTGAQQRILPVFNRCAIFSTTSWSYHGHPNPLSCPPDRTRKSMATYYYTNGRPEEEITEEHSTLFQLRPGESYPEPPKGASAAPEKDSIHRTDAPAGIISRPVHPLDVLHRETFTWRKLAWALTPPLFYEFYKSKRG